MRILRGIGGGAALLLVLATGGPAHAAWNNVFQVCCHGCRGPSASYYYPPASSYYGPSYYAPSASYYAPSTSYASPCCPTPCCPAPCCPTTSYVQRCYYQPVTCYKTETYLQPVTSYRTSYYYEPVTTYRSSCYYDPCTCSSVQVTTPCTSYRLRSQCNAVVSYVQRCAMVPVTSYRPVYYMEAVTNPCPSSPCADGAAPGVAGPTGVTENPGAAAPAPGTGNLPPTRVDEYPPAPGTGLRRPAPPASMPLPPALRFDRIVKRPSTAADVSGFVVDRNHVTPLSNARLVFENRDNRNDRQTVTADPNGRYKVNLPAGDYNIYLASYDGSPVFHNSIKVEPAQVRNITLVSR